MSSINEDDSVGQVNFSEKEGTMIIAVVPKKTEGLDTSKHKKSKRRKERLPKIMN